MNRFLYLLLIVVPFAEMADTCQAQSMNLSAKTLQKLNRRTQRKLPGVALAAMQDGKVVYQGAFGYRHLDKKKKVTITTQFRIASLSKQFTAIAAAIAMDQGILKYQQSIADFFPEVKAWQPIKVQHLIHHTSGLPDFDDQCLEDTKHRYSMVSFLKWMKSKALISVPGKVFEYSNSGYALLALVIEKASGLSFPKFLDRHIFKPASMKNTFIGGVGTLGKNRAISYHLQKKGKRRHFEPDIHNSCNNLVGDSGIYTTVLDYLKWAKYLTRPTILSKSMKKRIFKPGRLSNGKIAGEDGRGYAFGFFVWRDHGDLIIDHSGEWLSFGSYAAYYPKDNYWEVGFANSLDLDIPYLFP